MATGAVLALFWVLVALIGAVAALAFVLGLRGSGLALAFAVVLASASPDSANAQTLSPASVATSAATATPGQLMWNLLDRPANIGDPYGGDFQRLLAKDVKSNGDFSVEGPAKVPTKHGAVDAKIIREVPYSKLAAPWKKATRAIPLVGTGLTILDILEESCIRPLAGTGAFEQCYTAEGRAPPSERWIAANGTNHASLSAAIGVSQASYPSSVPWSCSTESSGFVTSCSGWSYFFQVYKQQYCGTWPGTPPSIENGVRFCPLDEVAGYNPVGPEVVDAAIDQFPQKAPDRLPDLVPKMWDDLAKLPQTEPLDSRSVDAAGLSDPKVSGPASKAGPKVTEQTADGQRVTQETARIVYQSNTTTVTNVTNTTIINNEGDVISEGETTEEGDDYAPPPDPDMPPIPDLYEQKYPDGLKGVWDSGVDSLKQTPIFAFLQSLVPSFGDGGCPQWQLPVMYGINNYSTADVSIPCWVWSAIRAIVIVSAALACRRIVFGG